MGSTPDLDLHFSIPRKQREGNRKENNHGRHIVRHFPHNTVVFAIALVQKFRPAHRTNGDTAELCVRNLFNVTTQ